MKTRHTLLGFALLVALLTPPAVHAQATGKIGYPQQCANSATNPTSTQWLTCTEARAGTTIANPLYTSPVGGAGAQTQWYTGAAWANWTGLTSGRDALSNNTPAPMVYNLNMVWDSVGSHWDRMTGTVPGTAIGDLMGATPSGAPGIAYNSFYDGTNFRRWRGETWDTAIDQVTVAPSTLSLGTFYSDTVSKGYRWHGGVPVDGQLNADVVSPFVQSINSIYSRTANRWVYLWSIDGTSGIPSTDALVTNGLNFFWDADLSSYKRWYGGEYKAVLSLPGMGLSYNNPNVNAFNVYWANSSAVRWEGERWDTTIDEVIAGFAPDVIALGAFYDLGSSKGYRLTGNTPTDNMDPAPAPYVENFNMVWDGAKWDRMTQPSGGTSTIISDAMSATPTGLDSDAYNLFFNGTNYQRWKGGSLTSSISAPVTAPYVGSIMYGYSSSGPTYYPLKTDATGVYVHQADLQPGQDAVNDWTKVRVESVATYTPNYTDTASVDSTGNTVILASVEILGYSNITVTVKNTGVTNDIDNTYLYVSPNGSDWVLLSTEATNITPGTTARAFTISENSERYLKIQSAATAGNTTSTRVWLTARVTD